VLGIQLYRSNDGPLYFLGHGFALGYLCANVLVIGTLWAVLRAENLKRDRGERNGRLVNIREDEWLGDEDPRQISESTSTLWMLFLSYRIYTIFN